MSVKVMTAVFDRYPNGGGEMLLALALADHASDDGTRVFPSVKMLSDKTRQSERTVQYQLRRMEEMGWLVVVGHGNGGRSMAREYRISLEWIKGAEIAPIEKGAIDDAKGANTGIKGCNLTQERVQPIAPANNHHGIIKEPSVNRHSDSAGAEPAKTTTKRKTVFPENFTPDQTAIDMANETGVSIAAELPAFHDHHTANGSTFLDWQAAFRTWLRNAVKFAKRGQPSAMTASNRQPLSFAERDRIAGMQQWEAQCNQRHQDLPAEFSLLKNTGDVIDVTPENRRISK